jgi:hypothetical protein
MKNLEKDSRQPWLDLLSQFHTIPLDTPGADSVDETTESEGNLLDVAKSDIALFAKLIGRDCYLLSNHKLASRISSCDALTMGFKFLAFVGSEYDVSMTENVKKQPSFYVDLSKLVLNSKSYFNFIFLSSWDIHRIQRMTKTLFGTPCSDKSQIRGPLFEHA